MLYCLSVWDLLVFSRKWTERQTQRREAGRRGETQGGRMRDSARESQGFGKVARDWGEWKDKNSREGDRIPESFFCVCNSLMPFWLAQKY